MGGVGVCPLDLSSGGGVKQGKEKKEKDAEHNKRIGFSSSQNEEKGVWIPPLMDASQAI